MELRTYYRVVLAAMSLLVVVGAIEYREWWSAVVVLLFGVAVWRAELPTWDELWDGEDAE